MDDNADRVRAPGQQPVPERDIEPPWPSDPAGATAASWATVPAPTDKITPRPDVPGAGPVSGQPAPGAPIDAYPSLTSALPPPNGWAPPGAAWAPAQPGGWPPPVADPQVTGAAATPDSSLNVLAAGGAVPAPAEPAAPARDNGATAGPAYRPTAGAVPPAGPAATNGVPVAAGIPHPADPGPAATGRSAGTPASNSATAGSAAPDGTDEAVAAPTPGGPDAGAAAARGPDGGPPAAGGVDLNLPFSLDQAPGLGNGRAVVDQPPGAAEGAAATDAATRPPGSGGPASTHDGRRSPGTTNGSVGAGRAGESPWAYPPQRVTAETEPNGSSPAPAAAAAALPASESPGGTADEPVAAGAPEADDVESAASPSTQSPVWSDVEEAEPTSAGAPAPPGPFPPDWQPPQWQQAGAGVPPPQPYQPQPEGPAPTPAGYPSAAGPAPTAEDFARRRQVRPADPLATMGVRAVVNRIGLRLPPGRHEQELKRDIEMVRRNFGGLRQVTVVNPKGGAGKTVAILLLAMTFGQKRGGYVLAWDNNETQGTLGMRAQQDFHSRTVRDLLRDLGQFQGAHGRVGDLSQYVRSQGEGMFDVLASDESATGGEMLTASAFGEIREVVSRFYKLIFVDTGNNVRAQNWQAAMDATDQLLVTMSARNDSAETAARMLDHLEQSGRQRLVRQAVTVVSMPPSRKDIDLPAIQAHFAARTRAVLLAPYERLIDSGEPIRYGGLSTATRDAWLKIAAAVAEGL
ncbi:chromosome partitioning protein [Micromonospora sp. 15K316]|nr:chromosome partitioning protein [Micromonospora sp. 15K316]